MPETDKTPTTPATVGSEALYIRQSEEAERAIAAADVALREHDRHPSGQSALRVAESLACAGRLVRTAKAAMRGSAPPRGAASRE